MSFLGICILWDWGSVSDRLDPFLLVCSLQDSTMSVSVRVFNLIGLGIVGLMFRSDCIVGVWLEPILGRPVSPPIVFANLTFVVPAPPSISSFV
jgi:hypothetical protein